MGESLGVGASGCPQPPLCLYYLLDREEALREKNSDPEKWNKNRDRDGEIMEEEET